MVVAVRRSVGPSLGRFNERRLSIPFYRKWLPRLSYRCNLRPEAETGDETIGNKNNKKGNQYRKDGPGAELAGDTLALRYLQALPSLLRFTLSHPDLNECPPSPQWSPSRAPAEPQQRGGRVEILPSVLMDNDTFGPSRGGSEIPAKTMQTVNIS